MAGVVRLLLEARDTEMLDSHQLLGHCPAPATRLAVNLKAPGRHCHRCSRQGRAQAGVLVSKSCLSRSCPLSSVPRGRAAVCAMTEKAVGQEKSRLSLG